MYIIAQRLVKKSNDDGYLVGSRGSVGSSLVATMANITEVNPLPPHYLCPECHYVDFDSDEVKSYGGRCGADMPDKVCPVCGHKLSKLGFDIPFETFLGFKGDKEPDIDLNFSGDEQGVAQAYTEVIFGTGQTFKAGTIGTVADKTAYGLAMHYFEDKGISKRPCELERLSQGCTGVRRTTGQHPGGVIVLPKGMNINWFTPVQHPANDMTSDIITTHFDYHSIDSNLLKLDILGHDDPTIIRMLQDLTGTDPLRVPLDDKGVLSLFSGIEALGLKKGDLGDIDLGTLGVPEFGTSFVMGMLRDTKPKTLSELIRISGLSHGTNVWLDNAQYFIKNGDCTLGTAICTRDDIMLNLIAWGVEPEHSFKIMESVRKGRGLRPDQESEMREHGVPEWYIESCKRIKYMFPKAHAAAYVMNAFRIAYYKINYPLAYYAAMFSIRVTTFDYVLMGRGREIFEANMKEIESKPEKTPKDEELLKDALIVREMYARGIEFHKLDLFRAKAKEFSIIDGKLMPSINSIAGLGDAVAVQIEEAAKNGPFLSKDDFRQRTKASQTLINLFNTLGVLGDIPETNQISLFDLV
jgi:DNA polymerase-3 subunit alpha (Gram-positive type)